MIPKTATSAQKLAIADSMMQALGYSRVGGVHKGKAAADGVPEVTPIDLPARQRPKLEHDHAKVRTRWSAQKRDAFNAAEPIAICLVGTECPVSVILHKPDGDLVRMGHNRGIWPMRVARTSSWRDTVTASEDKSPFWWQGVHVRFWFGTEIAARAFQAALTAALADMDEEHASLQHPMRREFLCVSPDLDLDLFELQMADIARRVAKTWWDDEGLSRWLDQQVERASAAHTMAHTKAPPRGRA